MISLNIHERDKKYGVLYSVKMEDGTIFYYDSGKSLIPLVFFMKMYITDVTAIQKRQWNWSI